ncbi:two-component regulator propeller domain-containing protein [Parabacteroides sp. PF5-6]|uniref:hybrid sensor histidine kinase/response regulator transcription factor n=1 Tax=Parabacteroides sp. PF5-6 TaxID=1742403 RepID=UPI002405315C|nr:two-component regulator propeller domain-containing protein [Parabacteroides sp. PF5-6]MDF9831071.1 signal transduction histidine kinase/ligand-binding sensor domain-containing protein/DNA-binding response OmpR family regulator [Parabacteroides sp. PF5-6]
MKCSISLILVLFSIGIFQPAVAAENYRFRTIDVSDGLSNSEIRCIYKDSDGFMWFGTPSGLNRYDGYEVITYRQSFNSGQSGYFNNDIWNIQESYDKKLWLQTAYSYTVYDLTLQRFEENVNSLFEKYCGATDFSSLYIDKQKNFWFLLWDDIRLYKVETGELEIFTQGKRDGLSKGLIIDVKQGDNCYWFLFDNGVIECMDAETHTIIERSDGLRKMMLQTNVTTMKLFVDSTGDVWVYNIGADFGMAGYCPKKKKWDHYSVNSKTHPISHNIVMGVQEDENGLIWIGTDHGGVTLIDKVNNQTSVMLYDESIPSSLPENTINTLYRDDMNIMWLGTYKRGVCYYNKYVYKFQSITDKSGLSFADINCFEEDEKGNVWLGTNGGGLIYYDRAQDKYTTYRHNPNNPASPGGDVIVSLKRDHLNRLWIGYYMSGLDCYDGNRFTHYRTSNKENAALTDDNVWKILLDKENRLWIGTLRGGVVVLDSQTGERLKHFVTDGSVYSILQKKDGEILIGSQRGLYVYNASADRLVLYDKDILSEAQLNRFDINALLEDERGLLWIGTRNGLFVYDRTLQYLKYFDDSDGLPSILIQSILEDENGGVWAATNSGIAYISTTREPDNEEPYAFKMISYNRSDGLQAGQFNYNAALRTSGGELVFGGSSGFNIFEPSQIVDNATNPPAVFTDFLIYNERIQPGSAYKGRVILDKNITQTSDIVLEYTDNYFTIAFAALDYLNVGKARYLYKLEGFNDQWLEADKNSRRVTYTNLNPGNYTFILKAISENGDDSEFPIFLKIKIEPPFWQTIWAWMIYIALVIAVFLGYRRYVALKSERKLEYAREKMKILQQHELDEMKLKFFTNISHEFRTPLSLIISPLEELLKKTEEPGLKGGLSMIHRNATQLLTLVNQLLDFRKLDVKSQKLNRSKADISQFVREQAGSLMEAMTRKRIQLTVNTSPDELYMWFDADKISKALINILYNAHKFTPSGGRVTLDLDQPDTDHVRIAVTDTGVGIPEEDLEKIFERFYQVKQEANINNQGSGIGLHLAKEFVLMHDGQIWAERVPAGGSRFVILLPVGEEHAPIAENTPAPAEEKCRAEDDETEALPEKEADTIPATEADELPKLLIIDDNEDFCLFLSGVLNEQYQVLQAADGEAGLERAFQEIPEIVVTDVMMPKMDGLEVCKRLKNDIRTSHIPVILLTSKSGDESKLEGLNVGADDYITKPFNVDILLAKIRNLVETQKQLRKVFTDTIKIEPSKIAVNSLDKKLIERALAYTESNMANPDFSVEELSRELGMSRVHLYKKLTQITGKTPIEFIRIIRLKRAAQLLKESQLTVSEIAYEVGFNNPKYFRKYFKDEFGVLPSQYAQ